MDFLSHITLFGFFLSYLYNVGFCFCVFMGCECRCFFCLFFFSLIFLVLGFVLLLLLLFACLLSKEKERKDTLEEPGKKKP